MGIASWRYKNNMEQKAGFGGLASLFLVGWRGWFL